uniref:NipSnap n=1 Tax=Caligus rogercresseyi TaxID=217165 RepID=C1BPS6_CALRO|nr:NipSnap [Caligus rogercresseyi]
MNKSSFNLVPRLFQLISRHNLSTSAVASGESGFFGSFFQRNVAPQVAAHSQKLSSTEKIILIQTHDVKPDCLDKYEKVHGNLVGHFDEKALNTTSLGHFGVFVGSQDQFIHIWKYEDGYKTADEVRKSLLQDDSFKKINKEMTSLLRKRDSQYLLPFSFWPEAEFRSTNHIYELRSYNLKPGTLMEWSNYWARAVRMRDYKHSEAYLGMFSQVGQLHNVNHIWCYESLKERKEARENVWQHQQSSMRWSEIVASTVPLVSSMSSRIMTPLAHSPTK